MKKSEDNNQNEVRMKLMGMGKNSIRKNYYRELLDRQALLEEKNKQLEEEINRRMAFEDELKQLNDELEERVQQRTLELENTQKELRRTERIASLGTLVMGISHELNTPLGNGLTASSYLIKQLENLMKECEFDREDNTALLETLRKTLDLSVALFDNFRRSADLVNSFKSIASDKVVTLQEEINMKHFINTCVFDIKSELELQHIKIEIVCRDDLTVTFSTRLLKQILMNLFSNAFKYAEMHDGLITIEFKEVEECNEYALDFSDNGVGMNQETKDRIFDPFFTSNLGKSTGLGMYIVHNLVVDQLEGSIEINSEENQGTLVSIRFPK